jgi:predicted DNA-binding transcriptional regulator YafY
MVDVCFNIMVELLSKRRVTTKYLAEKYEISTRTVFRYLDIIAAAGVNFFTEKGRYGGVQIADNFKLSSIFLSNTEKQKIIDALTLFEQATKSNDSSL